MTKLFNFNNIGTKIKNLAKYLCWIEIILLWIWMALVCIVGLVEVFVEGGKWDYLFSIAIVSGIFGPFIIWVIHWFLYAFGDFVENVSMLRMQVCSDNTTGDEIPEL